MRVNIPTMNAVFGLEEFLGQISAQALEDDPFGERRDRRWLLRRAIAGAPAMIPVAIMSGACGDGDIGHIREANDAERAGEPSDIEPDITATIHSNDLRVGDCFNSTAAASGDDVEDVEVVLCSAQWEFILLDSFETTREGSYPGEAFFEEESIQRCDFWFTRFLFPLEDNWEQGNRKISCLLQSRALFSPEVGSCYAYDFNVEEPLTASFRTSCDAPHMLQAFALAQHRSSTYPGLESMAAVGDEECVAAFDDYVGLLYEQSEIFMVPLTPSRGTWELLSHREIPCYLYVPDKRGEFATITGSLQVARRQRPPTALSAVTRFRSQRRSRPSRGCSAGRCRA